MNKTVAFQTVFAFAISTVTCIFSCEKATMPSKQTLLIQALSSSAFLDSVKKAIEPIINTIVKEELGLDKSYDFKFFSVKENQMLTLYYIFGVNESEMPLLVSLFDSIKQKFLAYSYDVNLTTNLEYFGGAQ